MKPKIWIVPSAIIALLLLGLLLMLRPKNDTSGLNLAFYGRICLGSDKTNNDLILHFILRGPEIYWDRNKDDIAQAEEQLKTDELELIDDSVAGVKYRIKEIRLTKGVELVSADFPQNLAMTVEISGKVNYEQIGQIVMTTNPQTPDWVHFHGNNRLFFGDSELVLEAGNEFQLRAFFGTNAIGKAIDLGTEKILEADQNVDWQRITEDIKFATILPQKDSLHPELTIEIPTSGDPFVERIPLNEFC